MRTIRTCGLLGALAFTLAVPACSGDDDDDAGSGGRATGGRSGSGGRAGSAEGGAANAGGGGLAGGSVAGGAGGASEAGAGAVGGDEGLAGASGPRDATVNEFEHPLGDEDAGKDVFRFGTFGNEGFWTRVAQLPQGLVEKGVTPVMALKAGLNVDIERVPAAMKPVLAKELATDLSKAMAPALNDPATTVALIEANAVIGLVAMKGGNLISALNGKLDLDPNDVFKGESVGVSCAFCHGVTDESVFVLPNGGTIGKRVDGPTNHNLDVGASLALAKNSRAFYPTLALELVANQGKSVSRKGIGVGLISKAATEAEVDAYLTDKQLYPIGMFDDATDGNGAPMHITPFFRADLAAPWGSEGSIEQLQDFNNLVYTLLLDLTALTTPGGVQFMLDRGGAAGLEIVDNYQAILAELQIPAGGENGYPFVGRDTNQLVTIGLPAGAKQAESPVGIRVDEDTLKDLNAYVSSLPAPAGTKTDPEAIARGRLVFRQACTSCHNDDQSRFVPQNIVPFNASVDLFSNAPARPDLFPGWDGELLAPRTAAGLAPVRNAAGTFDDKLVIVEASNRDQPRGGALPLLLDLARKPAFLHDDSVSSLEDLLDATKRDATEPHPFFVEDADDRSDVVTFLKSLDDQPLP